MADNPGAPTVVDALKDVLANTSETLTTYTGSKPDTEAAQPSQFTIGSAPLRTPENDANYKIWQEAAEQGDRTALIRGDISPETISAAVDLLVQSPELKDYIGQYALSNDISKNLEVISQAVNSQKRYTEDWHEVDGDFLKGGEANFLQRILTSVNQVGATDSFFKELRDKVNAEFIPKDNNPTQTKPLNAGTEEEPDALQKVAKLLEQREGEVVEDLTPNEAWDELRRIFRTPEYKQAQIEEIGYDPEVGHPDPEIQAYLKAKTEWAKQSWRDQGPEPVKPQNYEQRLNQPKIDYDNRRKQEKTTIAPTVTAPLRPLEVDEASKTTPTTSLFQLPNKSQETVLIKEPNFKSPLSLETGMTENVSISNIEKLLLAQNVEKETVEQPSLISPEKTEVLKAQTELPQEEAWSMVKTNDQLSEDILSNTEKTNTMIERLYQVFTGFVQSNLNNQNNQFTPAPVPVPSVNTGGGIAGNNYPPDAIKAAGQGNIGAIRSRFI